MFWKQDQAMPDPEGTFFAPRSGEFLLYRRGRNDTGQVTDLLQPAKGPPKTFPFRYHHRGRSPSQGIPYKKHFWNLRIKPSTRVHNHHRMVLPLISFRKQDRAIPDPEGTLYTLWRGRNGNIDQVTYLLPPVKDLPWPSPSLHQVRVT